MKLDISKVFKFDDSILYAIIKMSSIFPDYTQGSDIDIVCHDSDKLRDCVILKIEEQGISGLRIETGGGKHTHIDLLEESTSKIDIRFDLITSTDIYERLKVDKSYFDELLYRRKLVERGSGIFWVPCEEDNLILRFMEYYEYENKRKDKRKHLMYIKESGNYDFIDSLVRITNSEFTSDQVKRIIDAS
jgi:hypothetical protein